jgi:hypothetical protein
VAAIRAVLAALPRHPDTGRAGLEAELAGWARRFDPWQVRRPGKAAIAFLGQDGPAPRDTDPALTRFSMIADGDG